MASGTAQAGVSYIYSATDAPGYLNADSVAVPVALPYDYGSQWLATRRVFANFIDGPRITTASRTKFQHR